MNARLWMTAALVLLVATGCGPKPPAEATKTEDVEIPPVVGDQEPAPTPVPDKPPTPPPDLTLIKTDLKNKTVTIEGRFCLQEGILDYLAVVSGGHEYESVVALNCKASLLHASLLAMGAVTGPTDEMLEAMKKNPPANGKVPERAGTKFRVTVEWDKDGRTVSTPATQLLINRRTKKEADDAPWAFTGSYFGKDPETEKDVYMGDVDQCLLGVFFQPSAVMNFSKDAGNAYDGAQTGYAVNTNLVPKRDTPCRVILRLWDAEETK